jgi:outer membrane lipoprotein-sorting protein
MPSQSLIFSISIEVMKTFILSLFFVLGLLPVMAHASDARVLAAEQWLNNLKTGQARFVQRGYDGSVLSGQFYISRPGRLRFEYDAPVQDFVLADGAFIHFYDASQRQMSSAPIGTTLADFLLRPKVSFEGDLKVTAIRSDARGLYLTLIQTADPNAGQLHVTFSQTPFQLQSWRIVDGQGLATDIQLSGFQEGVAIASSVFVYKDPTGRGRLNE